MKRIIAILLIVVLSIELFGCDEGLPDDVYRLVVYGEDITKDNVKYLGVREDGKVMIPLLAVLRALGGEVTLSEDKCVVEKGDAKYEWLIKDGTIDLDLVCGGDWPTWEFVGDEILVEPGVLHTITYSEPWTSCITDHDREARVITIGKYTYKPLGFSDIDSPPTRKGMLFVNGKEIESKETWSVYINENGDAFRLPIITVLEALGAQVVAPSIGTGVNVGTGAYLLITYDGETTSFDLSGVTQAISDGEFYVNKETLSSCLDCFMEATVHVDYERGTVGVNSAETK